MLADEDSTPWSSHVDGNVNFASPPGTSFEVWWKRAIDITLAPILLGLASPILLVAMFLVKATSPGPFLYSQTRLGLNGRRFTIFKIRTMTHQCERYSGPLWSTKDDPRVTCVGRLLRRTHLDEIPQLWNVIRGEMSLIGPRPERPEFVASLEKVLPRYAERLEVLPGLTGLAQIKLPPDTDLQSVRCKLVHDLYYVENLRASLDLRILIGTGLFLLGIPFMLSCRVLRLDSEGLHPQECGPAPESTIDLLSHSHAGRV